MISFPIAVGYQCRDQVLVVLATDFGHLVGGIDIVVSGDAVAAGTGVGLCFPGLCITSRKDGTGREQENGRDKQRAGKNRQRLRGAYELTGTEGPR